MIYQHPLAYLVGLEGLALLQAWGGDYDEAFVQSRLAEVRGLLDDDALLAHPGVHVESGATGDAYRQWAATYDDPGNDLLELDLPIIDAILDALPVGIAVDTACGTGRVSRRLGARGHRVLGADGSLDMVRQARRNVPGVPFVLADVHDLPLPAQSVDLVTNALALTHVADLERAVCEFARVLRPGGRVIISDVHPELVHRGSVPKALSPAGEPQQAACHPHTVADYVRASLSAGFRIRGFEELPRAPRQSTAPAAAPVTDIGPWREWPWSLLGRVPEAARVAWAIPSIVVWDLERE